MPALGQINFTSAEAIQQQDEQRRIDRFRAQNPDDSQEQFKTSLAAHISKCWDNAKVAKNEVEQRMLDCLRRREGVYAADKLQAIREQQASEIYMMLTSTKCRAAEALVRDVLLPSEGKCWGLEPTPVSDIPTDLIQQFQQQVAQQLMQQGAGEEDMPDQEQIESQIKNMVSKRARKAADNMEEMIEDQFAEGGWENALEDFASDFVTFPAAILKGPIMRKRPDVQWQEGWQLVKTEVIQPEYERVSPFDFYPSPGADDIDNAAFVIERVRYSRADVSAMRGTPGYNDEAISGVLETYSRGGLKDWLLNEGERNRLEGKTTMLTSPENTIDALAYHGTAQGSMLLEWGMSPEVIDDSLAEYEVEALMIGRDVVRCVINRSPMETRPYHKASFQTSPGSFWGKAVPELMADIQDVCNAMARAIVNNSSMSSGPQVEVNYERLAPGEDDKIYPWKRWKVSQNIHNNDPAIRFFQPHSNAGELLTLYNEFEKKADDATNIPRYVYGNERVGGAGNTASGLSMLMDSANKGIKDAIRHIDRGVIKRVVYSQWLHNMQYSQDNSVKGDCRVVPRGSSAMLNRESTQQQRQQFLQGVLGSEAIMNLIGPEGFADLVRSVTESLELPDMVPTDDEVKQQTQQQAQQAQKQQQMQQQAMQVQMQNDQADAQKTTAEAQYKQADTQNKQADTANKAQQTRKVQAEILKILSEIGKPQGALQRENRPERQPGAGRAAQRPAMAGAQANAGRQQGGALQRSFASA